MAKEGIGFEFTGVTIVFICHDGAGNILFAKRSAGARDEHNRWEIPGGGLKFGERAIDGLRREVKEEFCATVKSHEFLGYRDLLRTQNDRPTHWLTLDFLVEVDRNEVAIGEPHKCDEIRWVRYGEWPEPLHSATPATIENSKERLLAL
jgi:ADP-ribose pyrophosphatase YjhB (NUDIX family)